MKKGTERRALILQYGKDILCSDGMLRERGFVQHGKTSVYEHSLHVTERCIGIAEALSVQVDRQSLIRGALLHDYFLYDWHIPDESHRLHGFHHAAVALRNAERDFTLNEIERNMIYTHMFPLNLRIPNCRESVILCIADKLCSLSETASGLRGKWIGRTRGR